MNKNELQKRTDDIFRRYIKLKHRKCQVPGCFKDNGLEWCHIDGRRDIHLRYSENNCLVMCRDHHRFFHESSKDFNGRALFLQLLQEHFPEKYECLLNERIEARDISRPKINEDFYKEKMKQIRLMIKNL